MASHKLGLEILDIMNNCVMKIFDTSVYDENISVKCPQLQITSPGFKYSFFVDDITPNFNLNLTACDLKIQKVNCGRDYNDLPDMIYVVKYSVSPNDIVFVEYNYLRITQAMNRLEKLYCDLDFLNCTPSDVLKNKREVVMKIREYIYGAKSYVEVCRKPKEGIELYKEAIRLMDKLDCKTCH